MKPKQLPKSPKRTVELTPPPTEYQLSRGGLRDEFDMPSGSAEKIRGTFFCPVDVSRTAFGE